MVLSWNVCSISLAASLAVMLLALLVLRDLGLDIARRVSGLACRLRADRRTVIFEQNMLELIGN